MIEAHHDPRLLVQVLNRRPLRYSAGADPSLDRPAHVRAASSLVRVGDSMLAIQDDAHFVALIDPDSWEVRAIPLPPGPFTYRVFARPLSDAVAERQHARSVCQDFLARVRG